MNNPGSTCGESCLNVLTSTECTPGYCPCGVYCKNQVDFCFPVSLPLLFFSFYCTQLYHFFSYPFVLSFFLLLPSPPFVLDCCRLWTQYFPSYLPLSTKAFEALQSFVLSGLFPSYEPKTEISFNIYQKLQLLFLNCYYPRITRYSKLKL